MIGGVTSMFQNYPYNFNPYNGQFDVGAVQQQKPPIQGIKFVQNLQEAQNSMIPLGSKAVFMDKNEDIFYLKETDYNGISNVSSYRFSKIEPIQETKDYITRAEFEQWKEEYEQSLRNDRQFAAPQPASNDESTNAIHKDNHSTASKSTSGANSKREASVFSRV